MKDIGSVARDFLEELTVYSDLEFLNASPSPIPHHKHDFKEKDTIPVIGTVEKLPKTYACSVDGCKEVAYLCPECKSFVPGLPRSEEYDDIKFLSGSAGKKYFCRACSREVGRTVEVIS